MQNTRNFTGIIGIYFNLQMGNWGILPIITVVESGNLRGIKTKFNIFFAFKTKTLLNVGYGSQSLGFNTIFGIGLGFVLFGVGNTQIAR